MCLVFILSCPSSLSIDCSRGSPNPPPLTALTHGHIDNGHNAPILTPVFLSPCLLMH